MTFKHVLRVLDVSKAKGPAKAILVVLCCRADKDGWAWPGVNRIAHDAGISRRTVQRHLPELEKSGELFVLRKKPKKEEGTWKNSDRVNLYRVCIDLPEESAATLCPSADATGRHCQGDGQTQRSVTDDRQRGDRAPHKPSWNTSCEPSSNRPVRRIEIQDCRDFFDPDHNPVQLALTVTNEIGNEQAAGFLKRALNVVGEPSFRKTVVQLWHEVKSDKIRKPGAILTKKLKQIMEQSSKK